VPPKHEVESSNLPSRTIPRADWMLVNWLSGEDLTFLPE
jgi:hypothetical protein